MLHEIKIPPAVKATKEEPYIRCSQLTTVILGEGLEEMGEGAFRGRTSLHEIKKKRGIQLVLTVDHCHYWGGPEGDRREGIL